VADDLGFLAERPGWTLMGAAAVYTPASGGWSAKVFPLQQSGRSSYSRFHVAVLDPAGTARFVYQAASTVEAMRVAERHVPTGG